MESNRAIPWQKGVLIHCARQIITKYGSLKLILSNNQQDHDVQKLTKIKFLSRIGLRDLLRLIQVNILCRCIGPLLHSTAEIESKSSLGKSFQNGTRLIGYLTCTRIVNMKNQTSRDTQSELNPQCLQRFD